MTTTRVTRHEVLAAALVAASAALGVDTMAESKLAPTAEEADSLEQSASRKRLRTGW